LLFLPTGFIRPDGIVLSTDHLHELTFDAVADPLVVVGRAGVVSANRGALRIFDLSATRESGRRSHRVNVDLSGLWQLAAGGQPVEGAPVVDRSGRETGIRVDVTPLDGAPDLALLHFRVRAQALARELWTDDAVASVAHEFRSPLAAMRSALNLLSAGDAGALPPAQLRFVAAVQRGVGRLSRIVDAYLDLGRVRAGVLALERRDEDVRGLVENILGDLVLCHPALRGRVGVDMAHDVETIHADRDRMTQVLLNLVCNAARFTPEGKRVTVRALRSGREALGDEQRLLPFELLGEPSFTCIEVEDEGIGMGAEALASAFEPYRDDADDMQAGAGAHLGLHIARELVEAHDGAIRIESRLGQGTSVRVFIPADAATARMMSRLSRAEKAVESARSARCSVTVALMEEDSIRADQDLPAAWMRLLLDSNAQAWAVRHGLALLVTRGDLPVVDSEHFGACRVGGSMTFVGAVRAAAARLAEQKSRRAARAVPGV
jgi:signal transduction histidine kinase